jgi:hypothetical protein
VCVKNIALRSLPGLRSLRTFCGKEARGIRPVPLVAQTSFVLVRVELISVRDAGRTGRLRHFRPHPRRPRARRPRAFRTLVDNEEGRWIQNPFSGFCVGNLCRRRQPGRHRCKVLDITDAHQHRAIRCVTVKGLSCFCLCVRVVIYCDFDHAHTSPGQSNQAAKRVC